MGCYTRSLLSLIFSHFAMMVRAQMPTPGGGMSRQNMDIGHFYGKVVETGNTKPIEGASIRLRPILMTSFAFIAGLIPLVVATGPGAIGNRTIGSAAAGGMLFGTLFGVIIIPGLYYIFAKISEKNIIVENEEENPLTEDFTNE